MLPDSAAAATEIILGQYVVPALAPEQRRESDVGSTQFFVLHEEEETRRGAVRHGAPQALIGNQRIPELVLVSLEHAAGAAFAQVTGDLAAILRGPAQGDKLIALVDNRSVAHALFRSRGEGDGDSEAPGAVAAG